MMKHLHILYGLVSISMAAVPANGATLIVERGTDFQSVINFASSGDTIFLSAKVYDTVPISFTDSLCGNCPDPDTKVSASHGFIIKNKSLVIIGEDRKKTVLLTKGGYGVYFVNSPNSIVKNLTITGGRRDGDGNATNAAIVVRNSRLLIEEIDIRDNIRRNKDSAVVVGIGGVVGREGADITIRNCYISNNGWDGVALYRGATALITDCIIKDGRGAGIGVTWDATCSAYRNEISGYWKGIGAFGTSWVVARNNSIHDNLGWGIIATGQSYMDIANNIVFHNGNCGVAAWSSESRGRIINNVITENGWRNEWVCPRVGVWNNGDWAKWQFASNLVWHNEEGEYENIFDQTEINGNLSTDPKFLPEKKFKYLPDSPLWNTGDTSIYNRDGTRSHIGIYGGPQAAEAPG